MFEIAHPPTSLPLPGARRRPVRPQVHRAHPLVRDAGGRGDGSPGRAPRRWSRRRGHACLRCGLRGVPPRHHSQPGVRGQPRCENLGECPGPRLLSWWDGNHHEEGDNRRPPPAAQPVRLLPAAPAGLPPGRPDAEADVMGGEQMFEVSEEVVARGERHRQRSGRTVQTDRDSVRILRLRGRPRRLRPRHGEHRHRPEVGRFRRGHRGPQRGIHPGRPTRRTACDARRATGAADRPRRTGRVTAGEDFSRIPDAFEAPYTYWESAPSAGRQCAARSLPVLRTADPAHTQHGGRSRLSSPPMAHLGSRP